MRGENRGFRGTNNIFNLSPENVKKAVQSGDLKALPKGKYRFLPVLPKHYNAFNSKGDRVVVIAPFVEASTGETYQLHTGFYQLN